MKEAANLTLARKKNSAGDIVAEKNNQQLPITMFKKRPADE